MKRIFITSCTFLFLCFSCNVDTTYILSKTWAHDNGFNVNGHDFMHLPIDTTLKIKNGIIYENDIPKARIIKLNKMDNELHIQKVNSDSVGLYINLEEFSF